MNEIFKNVYKNKKVFITGHTGFKGSWLSLWLNEIGAIICGYSLEPPTEPSLFRVLGLEKKIQKHIIGDIRDFERQNNAIAEFQPEFIFHLAAQPLVRYSYQEPVATYDTNIMGTVHLMEAARNCSSVRCIVIITSDKCYENKEWEFGYRETDPMGGFDPYSSSKGCSELVTSAYRNSYFNPLNFGKSHHIAIASARAGNVIGGGDWAEDRLVPDCIRSLIKNEIIQVRNPVATRPWQHVLEPLSGYLWLGALLCENPRIYSQGWNFGPNDESIVCVEDIVKTAVRIWGTGAYKVNVDTRFHEAKLLKLDISKSRFHLKWQPVCALKQTIENTIEWYKTFYKDKNSIPAYTINQIHDYVNNAREIGLEWSQKTAYYNN